MGFMIPDDVKPTWRCVIGDKVYEYPAGSRQNDLPLEVIELIANIYESKPKYQQGNIVTFNIYQNSVGKFMVGSDMTPDEVMEKMINGEVVFAVTYDGEKKVSMGTFDVDPQGYFPCVGMIKVNDNGLPKYMVAANSNGQWECQLNSL